MKKKLLFISGVMDKEEIGEISKICSGYVDVAANVLSWNFINAIESVIEDKITLIGDKYVPCYPINPNKKYKRQNWSHRKDCDDIHIKFNNKNKYIRQLSKIYNISKEVVLWVKKIETNADIIVYSMHTPYLIAALLGKFLGKQIRVILIVPDLPEFMQNIKNMNFFKKYLKKFDMFIIKKLISRVDKFILLTEAMSKKLGVKREDYVVIEGMLDRSDFIKCNETRYKNKVILYTGTLDKRYGVLELINAFLLIKEEKYELWICGDGDGREEIINIISNESQIKWLGQIKREEVLRIQQKATVLVNPRKNDEYTKYSFPSKTIEYLLSGTPVVMRKLDGIPKEYEEYLIYDLEETPESLAQTIKYVCEKSIDEIDEIGKKGREYVINYKNYTVQAEKLKEFYILKNR